MNDTHNNNRDWTKNVMMIKLWTINFLRFCCRNCKTKEKHSGRKYLKYSHYVACMQSFNLLVLKLRPCVGDKANFWQTWFYSQKVLISSGVVGMNHFGCIGLFLEGISKLIKGKKNSLTTPDPQRAFQTFAFQRQSISRRGTSSRLRLLNLCIPSKNSGEKTQGLNNKIP